jgi:hypothetical protein
MYAMTWVGDRRATLAMTERGGYLRMVMCSMPTSS